MKLQELGHIDELIAWLDNEQDGAEDAGFVAHSATNWHPALVVLKSEYADLIRRHAEASWAIRSALDAPGMLVADHREQLLAVLEGDHERHDARPDRP
jgi:hypothetical protein